MNVSTETELKNYVKHRQKKAISQFLVEILKRQLRTLQPGK